MRLQRRATGLLPGLIATLLGLAFAGAVDAGPILLMPSGTGESLGLAGEVTDRLGMDDAGAVPARAEEDWRELPARELPVPLPAPEASLIQGSLAGAPPQPTRDGGVSPALAASSAASPATVVSGWLPQGPPVGQLKQLRFKMYRPPRAA
jgi:hypothetical protein